MYSWRDELNGEDLTLRPEATASLVRAAIEHNLLYDGPKRLWYSGPMYRHERPQKGRYRQFHQYGAEALGFPGPDVDAELIVMCAALWRELGLTDVRLEINTIGAPEERARYRADLIRHLEAHQDALDADAKRRLHSNPLRVLDSKNAAVQAVVATIVGMFLLNWELALFGGGKHITPGEASLAHFDGLRALLDAAGQAYVINPKLVRGLDYYNLTVFEWISDRLGAQGTVCGGGRYDGLFAQIGGKPAPATGFAMGSERLIALMHDAGRAPRARLPDAYLVAQGEGSYAYGFRVAEALREAGFAIVQHAGEGSFKSQMKKADASGAWTALIVGDDEMRADEISFKPLRREAPQVRMARARIAETFAAALARLRD